MALGEDPWLAAACLHAANNFNELERDAMIS